MYYPSKAEDALSRKEFSSLKVPESDLSNDLSDGKLSDKSSDNPPTTFRDGPSINDPVSPLSRQFGNPPTQLKLHSHQIFGKNFMNPNTPYQSLHLSHSTGTGKTLAALAVAHEFVKYYRRAFASAADKELVNRRTYSAFDRATPTVFVFGFGGTKSAFVRELLKYPDFGFITQAEIDELARRSALGDEALRKELYTHIKKRITNKLKGGFYKFFGYDEFVNRLFSSEAKLSELETRATEEHPMGEIIKEEIAAGRIRVDERLVAAFENALIICDEVHNTYNMTTKNNRGVAIQYILDNVPSVRFLSLSATPHHSPAECVELMNFLMPEKKFTRKQFFSSAHVPLPGAVKEIGLLCRGRYSVLQDTNLKYFPEVIHAGDTLIADGKPIPYLKFTPCEMSEIHQNVLETQLRSSTNNNLEKSSLTDGHQNTTFTVPTDGHAIYDMVFPTPNGPVFRTADMRAALVGDKPVGQIENRATDMTAVSEITVKGGIITGDFMNRENIGKYSSKYERLLNLLDEKIGRGEKIMIYHDRVRSSGVLVIQEILRRYGVLDESSDPTERTLCAVCGVRLADHGRQIDTKSTDGKISTKSTSDGNVLTKSAHDYRPARFIMANSDIDSGTMERSFVRFNDPANMNGHNFLILLGSKIIKESFDFKDIRHLIILSMPANIPVLMQVFGRAIRKNSHINLPPDSRTVTIHILVSVLRSANLHLKNSSPTENSNTIIVDGASPELQRYRNKLTEYRHIQEIEREQNANAIDGDIHRDIIMPPALRRLYFPVTSSGKPNDVPIDRLGNLYYEPLVKVPPGPTDITTFNAYRHYDEEIALIFSILKRLFVMDPVWTYDMLWRAVRAPPIGVEVNPEMFSEDNFIIALHRLVETSRTSIIWTRGGDKDRFIYVGGKRHKVEKVGEYYIMFPIDSSGIAPLDHIIDTEVARDKERIMIKTTPIPSIRPLIDIDSFIYARDVPAGTIVRLDGYEATLADSAYKDELARYTELANRKIETGTRKKPKKTTNVESFVVSFSTKFQMRYIENAIEHGKKRTTLETKTLDYLTRFQMIVYGPEVKKYKDVAKQFRVDPGVGPVGYMNARSVRLYNGSWFDVSKVALNRHLRPKENDIIIGYMDDTKLKQDADTTATQMESKMQFKMRKPMHQMMTSERMDTRVIEKGIVCATKQKVDIMHIAKALGIRATGDVRIKNVCAIIRDHLIALELKEAQKSRPVKYMYFWWDER